VGNVTVWEAFQKAMWHFGKLSEEDAAIAEAKIADLVERAPTFAGGHAAFALLRLRRLFRGDPEGIDQLLADAFRHATRAVELDEGSSLARIALSRVYGFQGKYEQAVEEAEMSISLNPSSSAGYLNLAITLLWGGRAEEAMAMIDKLIRFSPNGPMLRLQTLVKGMLGYFVDDYGEAERQAVAAEASHILAPFARLFLAAIYLRQQRRAEARNAIAEVSAIRPQLSVSRLRTAWRTMSPRFRDRLFADLEQAGLPD
jgi:tetratricopeptide (TPR) repeat protein